MNCVSLGDNEHFIDFEYEFHAWCYFRHIFWKYQSFTSITFWNDSCRILSFTKNSSEAHIKRIALILITCCFFPFTIRIESNRVNWTDQMLKIKHTQIVFFCVSSCKFVSSFELSADSPSHIVLFRYSAWSFWLTFLVYSVQSFSAVRLFSKSKINNEVQVICEYSFHLSLASESLICVLFVDADWNCWIFVNKMYILKNVAHFWMRRILCCFANNNKRVIEFERRVLFKEF